MLHYSLGFQREKDIRHIPAGCVWHSPMAGKFQDYVNMFDEKGGENAVSTHEEHDQLDIYSRACGQAGFLCICKLPANYYTTVHEDTPAELLAKEKELNSGEQALSAMRIMWYKTHHSRSPTPSPTSAPTVAPTEYNKCGCGTFWQTTELGSFCTMCASGDYQPNPHNGDITECLACPEHHFSATGSCGCTDHGF